MDEAGKNRLKWKCRRGLLELDIVLARYLEKHPGDVQLKAELNAQLNELLDFPDNDLWDIVAGRSDQFPPHLNPIVERLRAA